MNSVMTQVIYETCHSSHSNNWISIEGVKDRISRNAELLGKEGNKTTKHDIVNICYEESSFFEKIEGSICLGGAIQRLLDNYFVRVPHEFVNKKKEYRRNLR